MTDCKSIVLYKQAQETMTNGLLWDYENGPITHVCSIENKDLTACGVKVRGPDYGWRKIEKESEPTCPMCKKEFEKFKQIAAATMVVATS
ncbi:MAG TPA: hypothetical protein EYQ21_04675 [Flavobacteriales bacterium]|nr:hypothetical protein [Flavobacteriales bacterium]